jgi:hypothetical protein
MGSINFFFPSLLEVVFFFFFILWYAVVVVYSICTFWLGWPEEPSFLSSVCLLIYVLGFSISVWFFNEVMIIR